MYCPHCGTSVNEAGNFCPSCGTSITTNPSDEHASAASHTPLSSSTPYSAPKTSRNYGTLLRVIFGTAVVGFLIISGIAGSQRDSLIEQHDATLRTYDRGGSADDAIESLQTLRNDTSLSNTDKGLLFFNEAMVLSTEGREAEALEKFRAALPYFSEGSVNYLQTRGEIAYLEGNPALALQEYKKALAKAPNDYSLLSSLAIFHLDPEGAPSQYDPAQAVIYAKRAYDNVPAEGVNQATDNLAFAYFMNEDYANAITYFKKTNLAAEPYNYTYIGAAQINLEQYSQGIASYETAKRLGVEMSGDDYFILGVAYLSTEQYEAAGREFRLAIESGTEIPSDVRADVYQIAYPERY